MSKVGDGMVVVALPLEALRIHGSVSPAIAIALVETAPYVLAVALSLFFGLSRHRFPARTLLAADAAVRCLLFTLLAALALTDNLRLWVLGVALFGGSALRLLAGSSRRLVATGMVESGERFAVNGLLGTSDSLAAYVAGPVLGGLIAAVASPGFVLLLDGVSFVGLLVVVFVAVPAGRTQSTADPVSGWTILWRVPLAGRLFVVVFFFNLLYMPVEVALPLLVRGPLHAGGQALGVMWTAFGVGALLGALATNRLRRLSRGPLLVAIIAGWSASVLVLSVAPNIAVAAGAFALGGLIYAPFTPIAYSLVQDALQPAEQQPVITLWAAGATIAAPLGLALSGPLIEALHSHGGLLISAALTLALVPFAAQALRDNPA